LKRDAAKTLTFNDARIPRAKIVRHVAPTTAIDVLDAAVACCVEAAIALRFRLCLSS
jgi:hypothetical protein